jgi:2-keto-4-pentenoate hydratase
MSDDSRITNGMRRQSELRARRIHAGAKVIGWKVGFGAPAAQAKMKLSGPLIGFLLDRAVLPSGAPVSVRGWHKPVAEPEIAVHIGRDLPADASLDTVRVAIAGIGPAIEIADVDGPTDDVEAVLAGDIFQRHIVVGKADTTRAGARLDGLQGCVVRSGKAIDVPADLEANTGRLVDIVRQVAGLTAHYGEGLRAGHIIIAGSVVAPLFVAAGESVVFTLDPVDTISVKFEQ